MKVLVVAHPDDEILWFDPSEYDHIYVVFLGREDKPRQTDARRKALEEHPLARKMTCLGFTETGYWRDKTQRERFLAQLDEVKFCLGRITADSVTTHNAQGEYGHDDHRLVHRACMEAFDCPVNGKDPHLYRRIRKVYEKHGCWTWL